MIPNNQSNNNGCTQNISSNCVLWQGPDIECLNLCNGATISDVVATLAQGLCDCCGDINLTAGARSARSGGLPPEINVNELVQKCLATDNGRNAETTQELLQWIIDKICDEDSTGSSRSGENSSACDFATSCSLPLPDCTQYEIGGTVDSNGNRIGGTLVTEEVLYDPNTNSGWIITVGNYVCGIWGAIQTINTRLDNHDSRITLLENAVSGGTRIGGSSTVTQESVDSNGNPITTNTQTSGSRARRNLVNKTGVEEVIAKYLRHGQITAGSLALTVEKEVFELRAATGTGTQLRKAIQYQQTALGTRNRLNGVGTMAALTGFKVSARNVADSIQNLWITTNDMRSAVENLKTDLAPTACSDITFDFKPVIQYNASGAFESIDIAFMDTTIPTGWNDCGAGTKITISDAALNTRTYYADISTKWQNSTLPFRVTDITGLDITGNFLVKVDFCVTNEASQCGESISLTVQNATPCPRLAAAGTTYNSVNFTYNNIALKAGKEASIAVNLLDSTGSIVQTRTATNWASGFSGNFSGLNAGTAYQLQFQQKSQTGQVSTCTPNLVNTTRPSCTQSHILSSSYSTATADQVAGSNSMELAQWNDGSTISLWTVTFDASNAPIVIKSNPTTAPATAWTHQGDFISDNPTEPISCGEKTFTASGMRTNMAGVGYSRSGWKYIGALTDPGANVYYVYALINSETHDVVEVVLCCDCKQTTLVLDNHYGVFYCVTGKSTQIKINVVGDTAQQTVSPVWSIVSQPNNGTIMADPASSTPSQGIFNYNHDGKVWTADSFTVKYTGSCGTTGIITVPIIRAIPLSYKDEDIVVFVDTTTYSAAEADGIKATFNAMKTTLMGDQGWTGDLYFVGLAAGASANHKEPGDYIKHSRSLIDSHNGGTTTSITINTTGTWNAWNDIPYWWGAGHGAWKSSISVFSFVAQGNSNGNYGSAALANGWTTPTQPTAGVLANVTNANYKEDIDSHMDMFSSGTPKSQWSLDNTSGGKEWKAGSIPFILKQFIINKNTTTIGESAANILQLMSAQNTGFLHPRNFYGLVTGGINFPVDVSAYLLAGTATAPNPYNTNSTASVTIKGLENFNVVPHLYFDTGNNGGGSDDWGTVNTNAKFSLLRMLGVTAGSGLNAPSGSGFPKMGMSHAFRAATGTSAPDIAADQAATCLLSQTPGNCTTVIWNATGGMFDADVKAYTSQSGATNAQSEYELTAGYYAQCPYDSGVTEVAEYVPAGGAGNYWRNKTNCV